MKTIRPILITLLLAIAPALVGAAGDPATMQAVDDARVQAMVSADAAKLDAALSDELLYVHSNGRVDTKASISAALVSGQSKYNSITYSQREFREVVPGLVLMNGRCRVVLGQSPPFRELDLSFLAAYRLEQGRWRFIAWQSCRMPEPAPAAKG